MGGVTTIYHKLVSGVYFTFNDWDLLFWVGNCAILVGNYSDLELFFHVNVYGVTYGYVGHLSIVGGP